MRPQTWLLFGCFGLGAIITYCWWAAIRTSLFRLRLAEIRAELDFAASRNNRTGHESYIDARRAIDWLIEFAPFFSMPVFLVFRRMRSSSSEQADRLARQVRQDTDIRGSAEDLDEVRNAVVQAAIAVTVHMVVTPSFLAYFLWTTLSGRSEHLVEDLAGRFAEVARMSHESKVVEGLAVIFRGSNGARVATAGR